MNVFAVAITSAFGVGEVTTSDRAGDVTTTQSLRVLDQIVFRSLTSDV